ncbi:hypothetical protein [Shimia isoporae]|nr:hypothetical protein [Shimia isoporae]
MNQQSIIGSLDNILESSWIKYLVCAQVVFAAFMLALGMSSRLIVLWVLLLVVSLTSFHLQNGAVLSGFIAARFIVFLAAAAPILLSGGGSFSIRPTGWHINRHPRVEPSDGVSTYF